MMGRAVFAVALSACAWGASVGLAGACGDVGARDQAAFAVLLNATRAERGAGALVPDPALAQAAGAYACVLARSGHFAHVGPDGSTPDRRMRAAGFGPCEYAENIAREFADAAGRVAWVLKLGRPGC